MYSKAQDQQQQPLCREQDSTLRCCKLVVAISSLCPIRLIPLQATDMFFQSSQKPTE